MMNARTGRALSTLAHIRQSLADILTTPIGSRVMRRNYGSEVPELIDQPLHGATVLRIYAATAHAVMLWEPRIALTGLQLERGTDGSAALILDGVTSEQAVQLAVLVGSTAGAARAVMLAYALDNDLDHLGALMDVPRLQIWPADPDKGTAAVMEQNEDYRRRIQLAPQGLSVAGPEGAYIFHALSSDGRVRNATATSPAPGHVVVTILSHEGDGTPSQELLNIVAAHLAQDGIRPLTDYVLVRAAQIEHYQVKAVLFSFSGPDSTVVVAEGAHRFIEPAPGVLARAKSKQHNIIFGRRGSGKSSLLRKMAADLTVDRRPIAFVDMETFKGHSYPDVLISVLIKSLHEFKKWLDGAAITPATKKSFWSKLFGTQPKRPPFNKASTATLTQRLSKVIEDLEHQLSKPESSENQIKQTHSAEQTLGAEAEAEVGISGSKLKTKVSAGQKAVGSTEEQSIYVSHKIEYLHQNILKFQNFFQELAQLSDGSSFLILDDLYHIRKADQAKVIDYFHRIAKGNGMWLKVGTIKHRSQWYQHSDPPMGMKLGDDAKEINLDISLEKFTTLKEFLRKILGNLMSETPPLSMKGLMNPTAIDRLIIASGGVTRDFIGIFSKAILQAQNRGIKDHRGPKVGAEDVNLATGDYDPMKREEFKLDTDSDRILLENAFQHLVTFCTETSKCNIFLVSQKLAGPVRDAIDQLIDLRLIHPVKSRVTLKKGAAGELFEAYMLDLSQYTAARKVHKFNLVDLSAGDKDEIMRKSSLIYTGA